MQFGAAWRGVAHPIPRYAEKLTNSSPFLALALLPRPPAGFTLDGGLKDASHIRRLATSVNVPMPTVDAAHAHLVSARANAPPGKELDWSSLFVGQRLASGLDPFARPEVLLRDTSGEEKK